MNVAQKVNNMLVEEHYSLAMAEFAQNHTEWRKFRSCTAEYCFTENYIILRSYSTIVAVINQEWGVCYDALRMVYGYTSTSNQHICKFWHDFGSTRITWR